MQYPPGPQPADPPPSGPAPLTLPAPADPPTDDRGLRRSLVAVVLAAVLPVLLLAGIAAWMGIDEKQHALAERLASTARGVQSAVDRALDTQVAAMEVLATDVSLDTGDLASFRLRAVRAVASHPDWRNVALIDPVTQHIVSSVLPLPPGAPITTSYPHEVAQVAASRKPLSGRVLPRGRLLAQPLVFFLAPVVRDDQVRYVLAVSMDPRPLAAVLASQSLPERWGATVVDDRLRIAGRTRDAGRLVGERASSNLARHMAGSDSGMFASTNREGEPVHMVFSRSAESGWSTAVAVPSEEVDGPNRAAMRQLGLLAAALLMPALFAAGALGRSIASRRRAHATRLHEELARRARLSEALLESQARFRDYSGASADWYWETDAQHRFSHFSDNHPVIAALAPRLLGRTRAELLRESGVNAEALVGAHEAQLERHEPFRDFTYRAADAQGAVQWWSVSGVPHHDSAGAFLGYRGVGRDVTRERETAEAAERNARLLRDAVNGVAIGFAIYDEHDRLVSCNEAHRSLHAACRDLIVPGARYEDIVRGCVARGHYPEAADDAEGWIRRRMAQHLTANGEPVEKAVRDGRWHLVIENRTSGGLIVVNQIDITERKRTEQALNQLSLAVEQSSASVVIANLHGEIEYVNDAFVRKTGYTRDEALGRNPSFLHSGRTPASTYEAMWQALRAGLPWRGELRNQRRDGTHYIDLSSMAPVRGRDGRVTHYVSVAEDITELTRLTAELQEHRTHLERLVQRRTAELEHARDAAQAANVAKTEFLANMSHELRTPLNAISGMSYMLRREGIAPQQLHRLDAIDTAARHLLEVISAILDLSKIEAGELQIEQADVVPREVVDHVVSLLDGPARAKGLALRAEIGDLPARLRGDPARLQQALLNYAANAVKFTERGTVVIAAHVVQQSEADAMRAFNRMLDEVQARDAALADANRTLEARVAERTQALERETARAIEASQAKTRFLATMSHELRTPLNAVIGAAQLLQQSRAAQSQAHLVDTVRDGGTALLGLIENVLDVARIESGALELAHVPFDLVECVESLIATAAVGARAKGIALAAVIDPQLPAWRVGDPVRLAQVLRNFLGNALKFTLRGEVVLRVRRGDTPDALHMTVEDSGIGIEREAMERLFQPFSQVDASTTRRFGGSGLGLAISRQLAQAMGGRVWVESRPGVGSCFGFALTLPRCEPASPEPLPPARSARRPVAVVDAHEAGAQALMALLERLGCEATRCPDAYSLRAWLRRAGPAGRVLAAADQLGTVAAGVPTLDAQRLIVLTDHPGEGLGPQRLVKPVMRAALERVLCDDAEADDPAFAAASGFVPPQDAPRVLVVEDDPTNRMIVCSMLDSVHCVHEAAPDGCTALRALSERRFDLVLLDWRMPDMDGLEVARRVRAGAAGEAARHTPIVALTANAFAEDRAACLDAGMDDFLTKPVHAAQLSRAVERWAGARHARRAQAA